MAVRTDRISLDVSRTGRSAGTLRFTEHDRGSTIEASLCDGGRALDTAGLTAELRADAPGGYVRAALPLDGATCSYTLSDDLTSRAGRGRACVALLMGDAVVCSTQHFDFEVVAAADLTAGEAEHAQSDFDRLTAEWEAQTRRQADGFEAAQAERAEAFEKAEKARADEFSAAEKGRAEAERARATAEEARAWAESARSGAEKERVAAESGRAGAEASRASAESARAAAEKSRAASEESRASAEKERASRESGRASAERARGSAESGRAEAEAARASAEEAREAAELLRSESQARNDADQALNNEAARSMQPHVCGPGEYDAATMRPTVAGPVEGRMYLVPMSQEAAADSAESLAGPVDGPRSDALSVLASAAAGANAYVEWLFLNGAWEQVGVSQKQVVPVSTAEIDSVASGGSPKGESVLTLTGLSYLWARLKGAFAALSHAHSIAQVTGLDAALAGKAAASHAHAIADVTDLQAAIDGKAAASHGHGAATQGAAGFMSASDKKKLDGVAAGATAYADSAAWLAAHPVGTYVVAAAGFDPRRLGGAWEARELMGAVAWKRTR